MPDSQQKPSSSKGKPVSHVRYYKISTGEGGWQWEECKKEGFVAMGFDDMGDLSEISREDFLARRYKCSQKMGWKPRAVNQVWRFHNLRKGDRIVANHGTGYVLGFGVVTGPYYFAAGAKRAHRLPVEWTDTIRRPITRRKHWVSTIIELSKEEYEELAKAGQEPPSPTKSPVAYTLAQLVNDTGIVEPTLRSWIQAIERKKQAVLYGPPGTGKTYVAERLAQLLCREGGIFKLLQFHPAYAYEDFIEGIRPIHDKSGQLMYELRDGRFKDFCKEAAATKATCVLILDELNRANLSRVFGELMYLLEYRDREVPLASGRLFRVPDNVRIIGTMNTADRSIALVDHALRRRFAFLSLMPNFEVLRSYHAGRKTGYPIERLIAVLKRVNEAIKDPHHALGTSFFMRPDLKSEIESIWCMEIEPYLEEYFFGQQQKIAPLRWAMVGKELAPAQP